MHAKGIFEMFGSFAGLKSVQSIVSVLFVRLMMSVVSALLMIAFLDWEAMILLDVIVVVNVVGVLRLVSQLLSRWLMMRLTAVFTFVGSFLVTSVARISQKRV